MKRPWSRLRRRPLSWGAAVSVVIFAALLALRIGHVVPVPAAAIVALATIGLVVTLGLTVVWAVAAWRGPEPEGIDPANAVECDGAEAERVRLAAQRRSGSGGSGHVRPWAVGARVLMGLGACGVLLSGLLNAAFHVEGTWIQFADSGRDLDVLATYRDLDVGLLADARKLRYGVVVGSVRPRSPERLLDLGVVNASGAVVSSGELGAGKSVHVGPMSLYQWALGPAVHVTVVHRERGRLFDAPVPLWPAGGPGRYVERVEGDGMALEVIASGWPWADGAGGIRASLRGGGEVLFDGPLDARRVAEARDGYAIVVWESRPWVGLGVVHRTYRSMTLASLALAAAGALLSLVLPPRAFRYVEEGGGRLRVSPASSWAALRARRGG